MQERRCSFSSAAHCTPAKLRPCIIVSSSNDG
jgi:hypothetical protein